MFQRAREKIRYKRRSTLIGFSSSVWLFVFERLFCPGGFGYSMGLLGLFLRTFLLS
jgi:hypothetical protein